MKKNKPIQISIPQPCSEDWGKMTPQEQGRFCDSCQKCVVDFTGFNDHQLYDYLHTHKGEKVCGRFQNTQLNRTLHLPPQPHSRLYRIAIAVGLTLAIISTTEVNSFAKAPLIEYNEFIDNPSSDSTNTISGTVVDEHGEPLIDASIKLIDSNGIIRAGTVTDYDGIFKLSAGTILHKSTLKVNYYNFKESIIALNRIQEPIKIVLKPLPDNLQKEVIIPVHLGGVVKITEVETMEENLIRIDNKPLIDTLNPSPMNKTISGEEINRMAH